MNKHRIVSGFAAVLIAAAGGVVGAAPSMAATSSTHCTERLFLADSSHPAYGSIVPGTTSGSTDCRLTTSSPTNNEAVKALQDTLNFCYGENLLLDGDFGPLTSQALARAQADEGIIVDGWYGNDSRDHLRHRYYFQSNPDGCFRL